MRCDLFRMIMLQREQADLMGRDLRQAEANGLTPREWWLRQVFGEQIAFQHYGAEFHFVPEQTPITGLMSTGRLIVGRIGRPFHFTENLPPEDGLTEIERDAWKAAAIIIDPKAHDDGQKAAMEVDGRVGRTTSVLKSKSLTTQINQRIPAEPFILEINPLAWISTAHNLPNIFAFSVPLDQAERAAAGRRRVLHEEAVQDIPNMMSDANSAANSMSAMKSRCPSAFRETTETDRLSRASLTESK